MIKINSFIIINQKLYKLIISKEVKNLLKKILTGTGITIISLYLLFQVSYYATSVPQFCASCHEVSAYVPSWQTSIHKGINCLECHQPNGELAKLHSKARGLNYVFQHFSGDFTIPTSAIISDQNCIQCHVGDNKSYPNAARLKNTTNANHYDIIKKSQSCLDCHRDTGHQLDIYLTQDLSGIKSQLK